MRRVAVFFPALVCVALASGSSARAEEVAPIPSAATSGDFAALVKKGDQARIVGKWSTALDAYAAALEIRDDPLVAGHLGLVLLEFREYESAAGKLFQAIEQGAGVNDAERTRFFQAFLVAKKETCRIDVVIVQNGVKFTIDGDPRFRGRREGWTFVAAGKHKVLASLDGFEDETIDLDAIKGGQLSITISLHPVKPPEHSENHADSPHQTATDESQPPEVKPLSDVVEDKPTSSTNSTAKNGSFIVGVGAGFVFGATPTPAVGPNLFGAWRSRAWWEVGLDVRAAWTFVKDERFPTTQFVTWSAMVAPCGRLRDRWFGCAIVGLDGMTGDSQLKRAVLPGLGLRAGREFVIREPIRLQVFGDATAHPGVFEAVRHSAAWNGAVLTGSVGARVIYKF